MSFSPLLGLPNPKVLTPLMSTRMCLLECNGLSAFASHQRSRLDLPVDRLIDGSIPILKSRWNILLINTLILYRLVDSEVQVSS